MSRDTMRSICPSLAFFLALAAAGVTQPALGQLSYTDLDTFLSASGSTAEAAMPASGSTTSQVVGAMTFTNDPPSTLSFGFVDGGLTALTPGNDLAISGVEDFNIDFATPITSLGFQWVDKAAADTTFTATFLSGGVGGTIIDVMNFSGPENVLLFDGFVTTQAFDRVEIREVGNDNQNEYFGQFFTGALAKSFNNPAGGNWDTAANWTGSAVPAAADYVYVSSLDGADVIGPAAATNVAGLTVDNTGPGTTGLNLQASGASPCPTKCSSGRMVRAASPCRTAVRSTSPATQTLAIKADCGSTPALRSTRPALTNLDGGTLEVDSISQLSGSPAFNWNSGTLEVTGASGLNVNLGGALGGNPVTIGAGKTLDVTNTLQVNASVIVNIDGGTVEAGNLTALFGTINANSGTVNIDGTFTNTGNVSLAGADVTVNTFDASVFAPSFSDGTLTIDGGSFIPFAGSNDFTLSSNLGTPTLTLENGAAMALAPAGTFTIGPGAGDNGMLNIASGSTVTSGSTNIGNISFVSDSIANVNGAGSSWNITGALNLGNGSVTNQNANRSRDQLNVDDDAEVTVSGVVTIGTTGRVNLDGGQITAGGWVRNASSIFDHTGGVLEIDGGSFSNGSSTYTLNGTDRPEIHLTNGATNVSNDTQVLNGVYRVGSGSTITGSRLDIYDGAGGNGLVVVSGAGSRWDLSFATGGALDVGITTGGEGELRIADGAVVSSPDIRVAASTGNNVGTVKVQDANSTLAITSNSVDSYIGGSASAGAGAVGLVEITAGGTMTVADDLFIGSVSTADGTVKVLGTGSSLTIGENDGPANDFLVVGNNGTGTLEVRDGGVVTTEQLFVSNDDNGMGVVTIDSTNTPGAKLEVSGQADIGDQNDGSLTVSNGGLFITSSQGNFAARIGAAGNADGAKLVVDNATWNHMGTERLAIGDFADDGTHPSPLLEIKNGGTVTAAGAVFVADQALSTGELIVDGPGSTFTGMARLAMGDNGDGVMTISGGATVATSATGFVEISAFSGGTGIATVTGPGSTLTAGDFLSIGDEGTADGMLTIDDGGIVSTTTGDITIARVASTSVGEVIVRDSILGNGLNSSTLMAGGSIYVGGSATAAGGSGSVLVQQGGIVKATNTFKVWDDATATLSGNGVIEAEALDVVEQGDFVFNQGTFRFTHPTSTNLSADTLADLLASNPDPRQRCSADKRSKSSTISTCSPRFVSMAEHSASAPPIKTAWTTSTGTPARSASPTKISWSWGAVASSAVRLSSTKIKSSKCQTISCK